MLALVDHGPAEAGNRSRSYCASAGPAQRTAADHVIVLDAALAQLPEPLRRPDEQGRVAVLVGTDAVGATREFAAQLAERGVGFSVGTSFAHLDVHTVLTMLPRAAWTPGNQARELRAAEEGGADRAERRARPPGWSI